MLQLLQIISVLECSTTATFSLLSLQYVMWYGWVWVTISGEWPWLWRGLFGVSLIMCGQHACVSLLELLHFSFPMVHALLSLPCFALQSRDPLMKWRSVLPLCDCFSIWCAVNCAFNTNIASGFPEQIRRSWC